MVGNAAVIQKRSSAEKRCSVEIFFKHGNTTSYGGGLKKGGGVRLRGAGGASPRGRADHARSLSLAEPRMLVLADIAGTSPEQFEHANGNPASVSLGLPGSLVFLY